MYALCHFQWMLIAKLVQARLVSISLIIPELHLGNYGRPCSTLPLCKVRFQLVEKRVGLPECCCTTQRYWFDGLWQLGGILFQWTRGPLFGEYHAPRLDPRLGSGVPLRLWIYHWPIHSALLVCTLSLAPDSSTVQSTQCMMTHVHQVLFTKQDRWSVVHHVRTVLYTVFIVQVV